LVLLRKALELRWGWHWREAPRFALQNDHFRRKIHSKPPSASIQQIASHWGGQKSTQNGKKVGQEVKKAGQGAAESWPGGDPELARRRPRAGQKLARTGPKAGQKLAKKWPKSDQKVILLGGWQKWR